MCVCGKDIKNKNLSQHQRDVHDPKNFTRDLCPYKCSRDRVLKNHKRKHEETYRFMKIA